MRRPANQPELAPRGFTLVELVVAVVVLAVGLVGLAAGTALTVRRMTRAEQTARAAALGTEQLERLRSQGCGQLGAGAAGRGGYTARWWVAASLGAHARRVAVEVRTPVTWGAPSETWLGTIPCRP